MGVKDTRFSALEVVNATIASSGDLSGEVNLGGLRLCGLLMPDAWVSAAITFQASFDGGTTWVDIYKDGAEYSETVDVDQYISISPEVFAAVPRVKVRSGTSGTPVTQTSGAVIGLVLRGV